MVHASPTNTAGEDHFNTLSLARCQRNGAKTVASEGQSQSVVLLTCCKLLQLNSLHNSLCKLFSGGVFNEPIPHLSPNTRSDQTEQDATIAPNQTFLLVHFSFLFFFIYKSDSSLTPKSTASRHYSWKDMSPLSAIREH